MGFDSYIHDLMVSIHAAAPGISAVARWVSLIGAPLSLGLVGIAIAAHHALRNRWRLAGIWSAVIVVSAITITTLKSLVDRARPDTALLELHDPSFPSGHALMAAAFFSMLGYALMRRKNIRHGRVWVICFCASFLIGASRLFLDVHWATDVLAGWAIGMIVPFVILKISKKTRFRS